MPSGESVLPAAYAQVAAATAGAFLAALWLSLILWTVKDVRARTDDRLAQILAVACAALLTIPGWLLYLLLRPARTLEAEYQSSLEEEALLASLAGRLSCPGCGRQVDSDWRICPTCSTVLRKACPDCGRMLDLSWNVCPYCGTAAAVPEGEPPME
ncbi:MAG: zinc ribbon domain-containing protein [Anaerolineales bacterium]|nr:zinc ribbon domain-containing protein [Anaerolineales bacterium]